MDLLLLQICKDKVTNGFQGQWS